MTKNLVIVGSINLDLVVQADHLPLPGETITGSDFVEFGGGKGANQAVGIGRLGYPAVMLGYVGSDSYGEHLKSSLAKAGVDIAFIETAIGPSGIALITHGHDGQNSIVVVPGANAHVSTDYLHRHRERLLSAGMILSQLEIPIETVKTLAEIAAAASIPFVLDPAPAHPLSERLLKKVTWLTPNETEAATLTGQDPEHASPAQIAKSLLSKGPHNVAVKLGSRGVYLAGKDTPSVLVPTFNVDVVDTTAAGDTFNSAFAVRLMSGDSPEKAACYANAAAAFSVTRMGAQPSMPNAQQVEAVFASAGSFA